MKPMSKDDIDLLSIVRSSPSPADISALRRTQSLSQFLSATDDPAMVIYLHYYYYYHIMVTVLASVTIVNQHGCGYYLNG